MVIESVLSREWGNADEDARWRRGRRAIHAVRHGDLGRVVRPCRPAESLSLQTRQHQRATRPGRPEKLSGNVAKMIDNLQHFTTKRSRMESHFSALAGWSILRLQRLQNPTLVSAPPPTAAELCEEVKALVASLKAITALDVLGEPSPHNNLRHADLGDFHPDGKLVAWSTRRGSTRNCCPVSVSSHLLAMTGEHVQDWRGGCPRTQILPRAARGLAEQAVAGVPEARFLRQARRPRAGSGIACCRKRCPGMRIGTAARKSICRDDGDVAGTDAEER